MSFSLHRHICTSRVPSIPSPLRLLRLLSRLTMSAGHPNSNSEWKRRKVVSNFIFNFDTPDGKPKVALFRRSGQVSTYQHHLAPISGSIEKGDASPLAAAWREINEETTLTPSSLTLIRQGKSYTFADPSIRREWTIYPFAFRLKPSDSGQDASSKIKIDWEHESWDWYDPLVVEDSDAFGGVPRLNESLRRVWFEKDLGEEAARALADGLDKLANDFTSGARQMAGDALRILADVIKALPSESNDSERWWTNVRFAAWHIWKNGRESMGAAILSALLTALADIEQTVVKASKPEDPETRTQVSVSILNKQIESRNKTATLVSQNLANYIESTFSSSSTNNNPPSPGQLSILTLSESSTIYHALNTLLTSPPPSLQNLTLDIRILESRPLFEGVSLASKLLQSINTHSSNSSHAITHKITLHTDASAALASQNLDILLIGADRVSRTGDVSNKTGTLPAVLSARYVTPTSKILVLTESDKIAPSLPETRDKNEDHVIESGDPTQVIQSWQTSSSRIQAAIENITSTSNLKVDIQNISFEWCPAELIDGYITEKGEWTVEEIAKHSAKLGAEEARIFGNL